ncbi:MAG: ribonuclease J [Patescibacteria group bacterium]
MTQHKRTRPVQKKDEIKKDENAVRFIPLGGLEEVGRNCSLLEYKDEIIVIDVGIQFPEEETPGIDYIIPNITYLEPRKQNIRGIIFTHGHYDHIHALPYLLEKLGNPVIYTAPFTKALIEKRLVEFPNLPKAKFIIIKNGDRFKISENFEAEFFDISHTIYDAMGMIIHSPAGKLVHFGDFRLDIDRNGKPVNLETFERLGKMGDIHTIFLDSTNATKLGHAISEELITENLEELLKKAKGRLIIATFASLLTRLKAMVAIAERIGRKVALNGRSMKDNFAIAQSLGYIKPNQGTIITVEEVNKYPDEKIMILTTGGQGEPNAGLMRMVNGEHRHVSLKTKDTVVFSSSVVPGNERSVQALQDNISRKVDELYNYSFLDIHAGGHCHSEDLKLVMKLVKPKYIIPIHGYYFMRKSVMKLAEEIGLKREQVVVMDNGEVAQITKDNFTITSETVPASYVMVDGLGVGDVEEVVLRDRRMLSAEGMIVIIMTLERKTGRIVKNPDIISRGFILIKDNKHLLDEIRKRLRNLVERIPRQEAEPDYVKSLIRDQIGQFVYSKTKRRPMILPVLIEI